MPPTAHRSAQSGFTLVEIMVVIVILGLLATLVVPDVIRSGESAKAEKARTDVGTIQGQAKMFRIDNSRNPTLEDLTRPDAKGYSYLEDIPADPWGHAYVIRHLEGGKVEVLSFGPDGMEGTDDDISSLPPTQR